MTLMARTGLDAVRAATFSISDDIKSIEGISPLLEKSPHHGEIYLALAY
jgi:predicted flap endonuclease-1-like 5' DNA nuclease